VVAAGPHPTHRFGVPEVEGLSGRETQVPAQGVEPPLSSPFAWGFYKARVSRPGPGEVAAGPGEQAGVTRRLAQARRLEAGPRLFWVRARVVQAAVGAERPSVRTLAPVLAAAPRGALRQPKAPRSKGTQERPAGAPVPGKAPKRIVLGRQGVPADLVGMEQVLSKSAEMKRWAC
jgi:hypothetical protein